MPKGVYDRAAAKQFDRRAVALSAITPEVRAKMSASASRRQYKRVPCGTNGCPRMVTRRSRSGRCGICLTREWKRTHPDAVNASNRKYNAAKPDVMAGSRARWLARNPHSVADRAAVRRARKQGQFVEKVYRSKLYKRDEGLCGICGIAVDPFAFHVDHIVPLARGGEHSYANTQIAHPACNVRKGARLLDRRAA